MGIFETKHYHKNIHTTQRVTENVNVVEKRAPTDESIGLLKQMDAEIKKNILFQISIEDNTLNGTIFAIQTGINHLPGIDNPNSLSGFNMDVEIHYMFELNKKSYRGKDTISHSEYREISFKQKDLSKFYYQFLGKKLAEVIARDLISEFLYNMRNKQH